MDAIKVAKLVVKVGAKVVVLAAPLISSWQQHQTIKKLVAKEVAERVGDALKNR